MNKDFKKGSILEFNKRLGTIIVLGNLEQDKYGYILACPLIKKENSVVEADLTKMILLKEDNNELYVEKDYNTIESVVPEILKNEDINLE